MRFFINVRSEDTYDVDVEGVELPSLEHAKGEALESAKEMVAELVLRGQVIAGRRFEITDEDGNVVATVPFENVIRLS
jgi:hypothetical protein